MTSFWIVAFGLALTGLLAACAWFGVSIARKRLSVPALVTGCALLVISTTCFFGTVGSLARPRRDPEPLPVTIATPPVIVATSPVAAAPAPVQRTLSSVAPLELPQRPFPHAEHLPVTVSPASGQRFVKAGVVGETACFKVLVPYEGFYGGAGCKVALATATIGTAAGPDTPYFTVEALTDSETTIDGLERELLAGIASANARVAATGTPYQRERFARRGRYDTDQGTYLGSRPGTMFGRPARVVAWGFVGRDGKPQEYVDVICTLPANRYVWAGKPVTALLVRGYTAGYEHNLFRFALSHLEMR